MEKFRSIALFEMQWNYCSYGARIKKVSCFLLMVKVGFRMVSKRLFGAFCLAGWTVESLKFPNFPIFITIILYYLLLIKPQIPFSDYKLKQHQKLLKLQGMFISSCSLFYNLSCPVF